jgi:hypothetical protein
MGRRYRRTMAQEELARRHRIPIPLSEICQLVGTLLNAGCARDPASSRTWAADLGHSAVGMITELGQRSENRVGGA